MTRHILLAIFISAAIIVAGCDSNSTKTVEPLPQKKMVPVTTSQLLVEPIEAILVETATAALPVWREAKDNPPTLVLLSNNPFLQKIPEQLIERARNLTLTDSPAEIEKKAVFHSADPILMPEMAVSAALQSKLFSKVLWIIPLAEDKPMVTAEMIRAQLVANGDISEEEGATIVREGDSVSGTIRNTPWTICRIESLPKIDEPVIFHADLSYFSAIYKTEITTPIYSILAKIGRHLSESQFKAISASVSTSNISGDISLKTRFLGKDVSSLISNPELLQAEKMPELWSQRSKALYLDKLFQPEKILDIYLNLEKQYPQSASVKFGLFEISGQLKDANKAMEYLAEAVSLDRIYALEYINLSDRAYQKGAIQAAMDMLNKASDNFPNDPFITLKKIGLYKETGGIGHASALIKELQKLSWSEVYDPNMKEFLNNLEIEATKSQEAAHKE